MFKKVQEPSSIALLTMSREHRDMGLCSLRHNFVAIKCLTFPWRAANDILKIFQLNKIVGLTTQIGRAHV